MQATVVSILAALFFQFSVLPQTAVAATATAESVPSASADASNPESPRNITDTSESGATSPREAVAESKKESIAFLSEHLVPEPADPVSGSAALRAASAMALTLPITINSAPPTKPVPDHRTRKIWLGLSIAQHSGAAFDAWTTRRALSQYNARELDPLLRPVAGNASLYAAVQIGPTIFDFLSHHMMTSKHEWIRRHWWILQAASTAGSFGSGALNLSRHRGRRAVAGT
jgi:hypothetical protein